MPDRLNSNGLKVKTLPEIREELVTGLRAIYGQNINLDQNTPDGQLLNIFAQSAADMREVIQQVYSSFDPEQATGRTLDQRVALNGVKRKGASFTFVPVDITVNREVRLVGLDDQSQELSPSVQNLYTIKDDAGTEYYLLKSTVINAPAQPEPEEDTTVSGEDTTPGSTFAKLQERSQNEYTADLDAYAAEVNRLYEEHGKWTGQYELPEIPQRPDILNVVNNNQSATPEEDESDTESTNTITLNFRAKEIGAVEVEPGTITEAVTLFAGVLSINNPHAVILAGIGRNEETDEQLKFRRRLSVAPASVGYLEGIRGNLLHIAEVTTAHVYENTTNSTSKEGMPPHSIWVIIKGGQDADIADVIYRTKTAGIDTFGEVSYTVRRTHGNDFVAKFSRAKSIKTWLSFNALLLSSGEGYNSDAGNRDSLDIVISETFRNQIRNWIVKNITWGIGQAAGTDTVFQLVKNEFPNVLFTDMSITDKQAEVGVDRNEIVNPPPDGYVAFAKKRVTINDQ